VCSDVQGDIPGSLVGEDMLCERIGQMEDRKYLRESCYHYIECFVANSLAALMRK